jgi:hypothetical protein
VAATAAAQVDQSVLGIAASEKVAERLFYEVGKRVAAGGGGGQEAVELVGDDAVQARITSSWFIVT